MECVAFNQGVCIRDGERNGAREREKDRRKMSLMLVYRGNPWKIKVFLKGEAVPVNLFVFRPSPAQHHIVHLELFFKVSCIAYTLYLIQVGGLCDSGRLDGFCTIPNNTFYISPLVFPILSPINLQ